MKKCISLLRRNLYLSILFLISPSVLMAQLMNPESWEEFVISNNNPLVSDTFRLQTFNGLSTDNLPYATDGNIELFNATQTGLRNASVGKALKLPAGSSLSFSNLPHHSYSNIKTRIVHAAWQLMKNENLYVSVTREENPISDLLYVNPTVNNFTKHFQEQKDNGAYKNNIINIEKDPQWIKISFPTAAANNRNGFYAVDSIYTHGDIALHSLFKGKANWSNITAWSHLPAERHRNALIKGEVTLDKYIHCNDIYLGNGNIIVSSESRLSVNNLYMIGTDVSLQASGSITINGTVNIQRDFAETGKWYFVSLPFDVYASGIDPAFKLGDRQTTGSGNYFYICQYNTENRASNGLSEANWEVLSSSLVNGDKPIMEKGKGYLIALDEKANQKSILFSSRKGGLADDFAQKGRIAIDIRSTNSGDEKDRGWFLCGNPLPSPLILSNLSDNPPLDGFVYVYDGSSYTAHRIGDQTAIPPFSAFFVKAKENTSLEVGNAQSLKSYQQLSIPSLTTLRSEPQIDSPSSIDSPDTNSIQQSYIQGESLYLTNLRSAGEAIIMDFTGRIIRTLPIAIGSSTTPLLMKPGIYILRIETSQYQAQHKFVRNN